MLMFAFCFFVELLNGWLVFQLKQTENLPTVRGIRTSMNTYPILHTYETYIHSSNELGGIKGGDYVLRLCLQ